MVGPQQPDLRVNSRTRVNGSRARGGPDLVGLPEAGGAAVLLGGYRHTVLAGPAVVDLQLHTSSSLLS